MTLGSILIFLASIGCLVAWIWFIVVAFQRGDKVWGILLILGFVIAPIGPFVVLAFLVLKWGLVRRPAIIFLCSLLVAVIGGVLFVGGAKQQIEASLGPEAMAALRAEAERAAREASTARREGTPAPAPAPEPAQAEPSRPAPPQPPPPPAAPSRPSANARSAETAHDRPAGLSANETAPPAPPTRESLNPQIPPVRVQFVSLGESSPNQMRSFRLRLINDGKQPVREVKLDLHYIDAHGARLGGWTTVHTDSPMIAAAGATNEFDLQGFFVPQFTRDLRMDVRGVTFVDGARWPASR